MATGVLRSDADRQAQADLAAAAKAAEDARNAPATRPGGTVAPTKDSVAVQNNGTAASNAKLEDPYAQYKAVSPTGQAVYIFPDQATYNEAVKAGYSRDATYWQKDGLLVGNAGDQKPGDPQDPMYLAETAAFSKSEPTYTFTDRNGVQQTRATSNPGGDSAINSLYHQVVDHPLDVNGKETESPTRFPDGSTGDGSGKKTSPANSGPALDTGGVQKDIDAARALRDQFDAAYRAAHPGEAPKIDPTTLGPQTLATAAGPATTVGGTAAHADAARAEAAAANASLADAVLLDPTKQAEFRGRQSALSDYLNTVIAGKTPSVAQLQMLDALQKNEANQLGIASKASGGGNAFLALQNAANQIGRLNQGASSDAAILRAKEEADARAELAGVLDRARSSDITMADRNATLATDVNKTNAGLQTDVSKTNAGLWTDVSKANATNQTTTNNANAGRDTDVSLAKALADNASALQHERELNSISTTNAGNATNLNINQGNIASGEKKADASNILTQQEQDEKAKQDAAANAINASGQAITGGGNLVDSIARIQAAKAKADNDKTGQWGSAGAWAFDKLF